MRAGVHINQFEKYEPSAFTGKIDKFGQKARILGNSKNAHEIEIHTRFMSGREFHF